MIYLAVRLDRNSARAVSGFPKAGDSDQVWLHPSEDSEGDSQTRLPEEEFDDRRVQWFRSPKISYMLRDP
jgi:hypothetical protein